MTVKFKKVDDEVKLPVKSTTGAACWDVYAYKIARRPDSKVEVDLGFSTEIPVGYKGVIIPRSGLTKHFWSINNSPAHIDSDYRGNWKIIFTPITTGVGGGYSGAPPYLYFENFPFSVGDRVAQIYFEQAINVNFVEEEEELTESERGAGGFGSTGIR